LDAAPHPAHRPPEAVRLEGRLHGEDHEPAPEDGRYLQPGAGFRRTRRSGLRISFHRALAQPERPRAADPAAPSHPPPASPPARRTPRPGAAGSPPPAPPPPPAPTPAQLPRSA